MVTVYPVKLSSKQVLILFTTIDPPEVHVAFSISTSKDVESAVGGITVKFIGC